MKLTPEGFLNIGLGVVALGAGIQLYRAGATVADVTDSIKDFVKAPFTAFRDARHIDTPIVINDSVDDVLSRHPDLAAWLEINYGVLASDIADIDELNLFLPEYLEWRDSNIAGGASQ